MLNHLMITHIIYVYVYIYLYIYAHISYIYIYIYIINLGSFQLLSKRVAGFVTPLGALSTLVGSIVATLGAAACGAEVLEVKKGSLGTEKSAKHGRF